MGLLVPVVSTVMAPLSLLAVMSHVVREHMSPRIGVLAAATAFWRFHKRVRDAGITAEEMRTPIYKE
jgi:hypothetical protein